MKKILAVLIIPILAFGVYLSSSDVFADTKAVDTNDVTFTVHVMEESDTQAPATIAPNTGASSGIFSPIIENRAAMLGIAFLGVAVLVLAIKKIAMKNCAKNYKNDGGLKIKKTTPRLTIFVILGLLTIAGALSIKNDSNEEAEALNGSYPYKISSETDNNYDIYIKPGEIAKKSFAVKTTTDNETGFSLFIDADQSDLASESGKIVSVTSDTTAADLSDNMYGFSIDEKTYHKIPSIGEGSTIADETAGAMTGGRLTQISFMVKTAKDLPAGDYMTTLHIKSETNPVKRKINFANGNLAVATRVSDNQRLSEGDDILLGEDIKLLVGADVSGIVQTITVNGSTINNGATVTVADNMTIATVDDSIHFLKNGITVGASDSNGDAILVKSQGKYWLIDTGWNRNRLYEGEHKDSVNGEKLAIYLEELGIKSVDNILLTHIHADHIGGIEQIKQDITLEDGTVINKKIDENTTTLIRGCDATVYKTACRTVVNDLENNNSTVIQLSNDEETRRDLHDNGADFGNFHVEFYNIDVDESGNIIYYDYYHKDDDGTEDRENLNSIGVKLTHKISGKTIFLGGDFEVPNEDLYGPEIGKVDILKTGHHGNNTSNSYEFFKTLQPDTVINTKPDMARISGSMIGTPWNQVAAWAYTQQRGGKVYFTGQATREAIAINFTNNSYEVKNAVAKDVTADANTFNNPVSHDGGVSYYNWDGGLSYWWYPADGSESYSPWQKLYYVYVYKDPQNHNNNVIAINENMCIDGKLYRFGSDGVAPAPSSSDTCSE